ncbi:MAG: tail fiber domain-containing protein [Ferruginibacter sp.]
MVEQTAGTNYIGTSDAVDLVIKTSGAEVIRALSSGKVGIGTSSPNQKLEVRGTNAQPTGMNASTTNATFRVSGNTNHALDFGTFTNSPYGSYIESQNLTSGSTLPLVLNPSGGYVGIGVTNPDAPLQINASTMSTSSLTRSYFNVGSGTGGFTSSASTSSGIQVHANGYFWADGGGYVATSDARIKNIIGLSNTAEDLAKLTKIQVTDYTYIDKVNNTSVPQKKVIAQQLKSIYPIAVNQNTGIIPNVFETAATTKVDGNTTIISTTKAHAFKTGDMVKLIIEETGEKILEATVIDEHTFTVAQAITAKVFVYGKKG